MKKILTIGIIFLMGFMGEAWAQANRGQLRDGNRSYKKEKYDKAEVQYRRALEQDSLDYRGQYNLGNTLYRQKKYDEAARHFDQALQCPNISDRQRSRALHNKGNSFLKAGMENLTMGDQSGSNPSGGMQMFQQAVQSYQDALKLDPKNDDTRYNLAYARRLLQQAQQQQQNQQGQGQNQDQKNQNQQNQQNQQNKDQQNKGNQNQQNQNQQNQNQQGDQKDQKDTQKRPNQMEQRKQDAERMLEAVKNNERQSLKEQAKKVQAANNHPSDKDW